MNAVTGNANELNLMVKLGDSNGSSKDMDVMLLFNQKIMIIELDRKMGGRTGMQSVYFMSPFHIFYERRLKMFFPMWLMGIDIPLTRRRHRWRWDIETLTTR